MGEVVEIVKALVSPAEKLIDNVSKGIGIAYKPRHERKMADAEAYKIRAISEAIQDSSNLPVIYKNGEISMDSSDISGLIQRANIRQTLQAARKQQNIESVADKAYEMLESVSSVEDTPLDEDWLYRFFDAAENVSSEDMQLIWAKILAGEVEQPGRFSLRTLEMVKNLSKEEAATFQKILPLTVIVGNGRAIVADEKILKKYNVSYGDILLLDECGLANSSSAVIRRKIKKGEKISYLAPTRMMEILHTGNGEVDVSLNIYKLTKPAEELLSILSHEHNEDYFCDIAESMFEEHKSQGITVSVHIVESLNKDGARYLVDPLRKFE